MIIIKPYCRTVLVLTIVFALFVKCKPEIESQSGQIEEIRKSMKDFGDKSTEYRSFPIEISFFDPVVDRTNPTIAIQNRKSFIKQSGLPDDANIDEFKRTKSIEFAFNLYKGHIFKNSKSPYLKTFKQYGAWLILTRLDLLAQNSAHDVEMTYELTRNLAETNYEGFQLLSYSIKHLYLNKFNSKKLEELGNVVLNYASTIKKVAVEQPNAIEKPQKPLPPEIMESLKRYIENKEKDRLAAINQIEELVKKI
ncbi:MAG: hypothetical protein JST10_01440 [Bacteroidetes bacterium]|nr:hypothetical protein [Bacteroidota bacterium]MBS1631214.1 hypothetical protein [Bacteroidota bacterium]